MKQENAPLSIIVVEDEDDARDVLVQVLAMKYPEINFLGAANGNDALAQFGEHHPKIFITDINLPDMDGTELIAAVKGLDPDTKFLVISAHSPDNIAGKLSQTTICGYITKPIRYGELFKAIEQCISLLHEVEQR